MFTKMLANFQVDKFDRHNIVHYHLSAEVRSNLRSFAISYFAPKAIVNVVVDTNKSIRVPSRMYHTLSFQVD